MSNLLKLGGKTPGGLAAGISISEDGFINVNDTKQESMALGNIVYPEFGVGIKTVFGLRVFNRIPITTYDDRGKLVLSGNTLYFLDVNSPNSKLYLLDANTLQVKRIVEIGHLARDFCVDASTVYLFGVGFSTYDLATDTLTKVATTNYENSNNVYGSVAQDATHIYVGGGDAIRKVNKANKGVEVVNHEAHGTTPNSRTTAVPVIYGDKLVICSSAGAESNIAALDVYDKNTMAVTGRVSGLNTLQTRLLVATKHELLLFGSSEIRSVNTDMEMDSSVNDALTLKATLSVPAPGLYYASSMDGGFVACGDKALYILNEDLSLRATVEMGNLGVFGDVSGYNWILPRPVSDNAGHIYMMGDNEILKVSNELAVKGYRL